MNNGFFLIHREMMDPGSWVSSLSNHDKWLAVVCIAMANFTPGKWFDGKEMLEIPRGSFVTTIEKLRIAVGKESTEKKIRGGLSRLLAAEFIEWGKGSGRRYTRITVVNYSRYQDKQGGTAVERQLKGRQPAVERQLSGSRAAVERATIEQGNKGNKETREQEKGLAAELASKATEVLNSLSGRSFSPASISITADCKKLAKAGHTADDVEAVIRAKFREWGTDQHMAAHLKPSVLLRPSNFSKYLAEDVQAGSAQTTYVPGGGDLIQLGVKR